MNPLNSKIGVTTLSFLDNAGISAVLMASYKMLSFRPKTKL